MPRNILQDVLPPSRKSIRDIPIPIERRKKPVNEEVKSNVRETFKPRSTSEEVVEEERYDFSVVPKENKPSRKIFWFSVFIALLILIFAFSTVFGDATVYVTPKKETMALDAPFKARKADTLGALSYDVITFSKKDSRIVKAIGEKQVDSKAHGTIIIYNNESNPQTLIKNTRFQTSSGLVYRILNTITLPAKVGTKPGSLEVIVYADSIGSKYNIGLSDFTLPGFEGSPKFKTIYARSKTPMTGGASGVLKTASEEDLNQAKEDIEKNLHALLLTQARNETPSGFVFFDTSLFVEFNPLPNEALSEGTIQVSEEATLHAIMFNKSALTVVIFDALVPNHDDLPVEIGDIEKIAFSTATTSSTIPLWEQDEISFELKGDVTFVSQYDEEKLRGMIAGKSLGETKTILESEKALDPNVSGIVVIRPFWKRTLPSNVNKIKIVKNE